MHLCNIVTAGGEEEPPVTQFLYLLILIKYHLNRKTMKTAYQLKAVTVIRLERSYENFHNGRTVPSLSLNSSDASSQYLKSKKK